MTVLVTTWKRSDLLNRVFSFCCTLILGLGLSSFFGSWPGQAAELSGNRLPTIHQVAIMPVFWQGQFPASPVFVQNKKHIDASFSSLVRASKRFAFSNDVLTADLWGSAEGRRQLAEDYEIDAFVNLTVSGQGDLMLWTARLLNPSMKNYLTESERMPFTWLAAATEAELDQRLQNLLFRLLNRYPVDVYVTSIQGRFLTLSAGSEQSIFDNDELKFYQTSVKAQHPVDGSWLGFEQKLLGQARVIESKRYSAIAQITALSYADAILVGDGARVEAIASRRPFQQKLNEEARYVPIEAESPLVEAPSRINSLAANLHRQKEEAPEIPLLKLAAKAAQIEPKAPLLAQVRSSPPEPNAAPPEPVSEAIPAANPPMESSESMGNMLPIAFKELMMQGENENFQVSGSGTTENKFPFYVINRFNIAALQDITPEIHGVMSAHLRFGSTNKGSYFGFGLAFEPLYQIPLRTTTIPSLDNIQFGALINFESIAFTGKTLGGWDALSFSPTVHLQGSYHIVDLVQTYDYDLAARFTTFDMGQVGIASQKRKISDSMSYEIEANVIRQMKAKDWEWGGMFAYQTGSWDLNKGFLSFTNIRIGLAGRMRL